MDIFVELDQLKDFNLLPGFKGKLIHTDRQTLAIWKIDKDSILPEHHHVHEQLTIVTKGQLEMTIGGVTQILEPGKVAVIPSNVPHSGKTLTDCEVTDVFSPARTEYKAE